jgi:hypothetical protein
MMDHLTGKSGLAASRKAADGQTEVYLQLERGQSMILRALKTAAASTAKWDYYQPPVSQLPSKALEGPVYDGGPAIPAPFETKSWLRGQFLAMTTHADLPAPPDIHWYLTSPTLRPKPGRLSLGVWPTALSFS